MDPERQPLLGHTSEVRCRRLGPLTNEEVLASRHDSTWRRTRFCIVIMFWAIMIMFLSIITCILLTATGCRSYERSLAQAPSVPPVHMTFAPIIYRMSDPVIAKINDERVFTL